MDDLAWVMEGVVCLGGRGRLRERDGGLGGALDSSGPPAPEVDRIDLAVLVRNVSPGS